MSANIERGQAFLAPIRLAVVAGLLLSCTSPDEPATPQPPNSSQESQGPLPTASTFAAADPADGSAEMPGGDLCSEGSVVIANNLPKIFILADGSGSMFEPVAAGDVRTHWTAARGALVSLVGAFPERSYWGLGQFRGFPASPGTCAVVSVTPPAVGNASVLSMDYILGPANDLKLEGPISDVLPAVPSYLAGLPGVGPKILIVASVAEPDFCDDESTICPLDGAIAGIRDLASQGIETLVVGQPSGYNTAACPNALSSYANAGESLPIATPCPGRSIFQECASNPGWKQLATAAGRTGGPSLVDYSTTPGNAKVYSYSPADQAQLTAKIASVVPPPKSCIFDLATVPTTIPWPFDEQDGLNALVGVVVGPDTTVSFSKGASEGWTLISRTVIELHGAACSAWRDYNNETIRFKIHCIG